MSFSVLELASSQPRANRMGKLKQVLHEQDEQELMFVFSSGWTKVQLLALRMSGHW